MSNEAFENWFEGVKNTTLDHEGYESFTKAVAHQAWKACKEALAEKQPLKRLTSDDVDNLGIKLNMHKDGDFETFANAIMDEMERINRE